MSFNDIALFIRNLFGGSKTIPLHEPSFNGKEKEYVIDTIDSTFVSSVGDYVPQFEKAIQSYTGSHRVVATVNGTSALHIACLSIGLNKKDEVITSTNSFVAS